jgi:predicted Zn-dependent protease
MGQAFMTPAPFMLKPFITVILAAVSLALFPQAITAQAVRKSVTPAASSSAQRGVDLAETGRCAQALPLLERTRGHLADKPLLRRAGLDGVRCASLSNQPDMAMDFLRVLLRNFPHDPEVLYVATHAYSDLATRASDELLATAPDSVPARELDAESLEIQGKWQEAELVYRKILASNPKTPGIHFRIGRIILSEPKTATTAVDARKQFEEELQIDPRNADAEYVLGELAREAQQWPEAIEHFSRATKLDPGFGEAFLGLGMALNSAGRYAEAIPPLETYVKSQPANPTGHYQLAMAYSRAGRKAQADQQIALFHRTSQAALKAEQTRSPGTPPQK